MIVVDNLSFSYKQARVLSHVSFHVKKGECYGILGPSGSGKSTLLNVLTGKLTHWSGLISLNHKPLENYDIKERARLQQMIFQDPYGSLHPHFLIERHFLEVARAHHFSAPYPRIHQVMDQVQLSHEILGRFPHELSGGQRQRVLIALCLFLKPSIIYLDEPTSALDVLIQAEILNLLKDLQEAHHLTYIFISHDEGVLDFMCHRQGILKKGVLLDKA